VARWRAPSARQIKHITMRVINPEAMAEFYIQVYGFKEEEKALKDPNFYLTDGTVTMVLAPWKIQDYYGTEHKGPGLDHIGFKVENLNAFKNDVEILAKADPEYLAPKAPNLESEYNVVLGLLQSCRYWSPKGISSTSLSKIFAMAPRRDARRRCFVRRPCLRSRRGCYPRVILNVCPTNY
jgi:hypothetical protein